MATNPENKKLNDRSCVFETAISNIFKNIAESVSEDEFNKYFEALNVKPFVTQKLHKTMVADLYQGMVRDAQTILTEDNLVDGIDKLTKLTAPTNSSTKTAWRPPGDVEQHVRTPDMIKYKEEHEKLEATLTKLEAENSELMKKVQQRRNIAQETDRKVDQTLKSSVPLLSQMEKQSELILNCNEILDKD